MANPHVLELDDETFDAAVSAADVPVLVDFGATWCQPCRALAPIVESLAQESAGALVVAKVDVDESPEIAKRYGVRGVPTLIVLRRGERVAQHLGLTSKAKLVALVNEARG